ncbi:chorismate mutase [Streptococcus ictaluri]|uniref:Chorismate mutase n=1 Tax=Streptococcus ictaluri 707-05 TaxID=764299 RepID=G5K0E0_9STRE|nr:chorismate mutase [Streptococcus ictaluri]EHI70633.1 chorismate mutase [Streptococcus ictaluri 707-05]
MRLNEIRQDINEIDRQLIELLEARMSLVNQVTHYKLENQMPVLDQSREEVILQTVSAKVADKAFEPAITRTFQTILEMSRQFQKSRLEEEASDAKPY